MSAPVVASPQSNDISSSTSNVVSNRSSSGGTSTAASGNVAKIVDRLSKVDLPRPDVQLRKIGMKKWATVRFSYTAAHEDELSMDVDEVIEVLDDVEEGWMRGRLRGEIGVFPTNFVTFSESIEPPGNAGIVTKSIDADTDTPEASQREILPKKVKGSGFGNIFGDANAVHLRSTKSNTAADTKIEFVGRKERTTKENAIVAPSLSPKSVDKPKDMARVLFSYAPVHEDELALPEVGALVTVLSTKCEDPGWYFGELNNQRGVFPDNFVELLSPADVAREMAKKVQPAPPTVPMKPPKSSGALSPGGNSSSSDHSVKSSSIDRTSTAAAAAAADSMPTKVSNKSHNGASIIHKTEPMPTKEVIEPAAIASNSPSLDANKKVVNKMSPFTSFAAAQTAISQGLKIALPGQTPPKQKAKVDDIENASPIISATITNATVSPSSTQKLDHPTASRPRQPQKRPPSQVFISAQKQRNSTDEPDKNDSANEDKPLIAATVVAKETRPPLLPSTTTIDTNSGYVSRQEYDRLAREFDQFRLEMRAKVADLERQLSTNK